VIPARIHGRKASGGQVEVLLERALDAHRVLVQMRASKPPAAGHVLALEGGAAATVRERHGELYEIELDRPALEYFEGHGHVPLPPYIRRPDADEDRARYQTVYAHERGAVAAPTAGLHFDDRLLADLARAGVERVTITLHVGYGTFKPIRTATVEAHVVDPEPYEISVAAADRINAALAAGRRVVAVGTTTTRALEDAARRGPDAVRSGVRPGAAEAEVFIYPGFDFRVVSGLLTNFHLPQSSLLMLVSAFAGRERVLDAYREAVARRYRFYSYGDAMLIV